MIITSLQNPKVKAITRLHHRKHRDEQGQILIEGRHPVEEALKAGIIIQEFYIREGEPAQLNMPCQPTEVTRDVMTKMSTTESPSPMLAIARRPQASVQQVFEVPTPLILGVVALQDPGNLGTLIRSACAFGVTALLTIGPQVDPYNPKVIRASAGYVFRLPIAHIDSISVLQSQLQQLPSLSVWGTDAHHGSPYRDINWPDKNLILMGGEAHGLPEETWQFAQPLHIPMKPDVESLNVAVAGAIILSDIFQKQGIQTR